jgi:cell division septum initiation protein DivIVA
MKVKQPATMREAGSMLKERLLDRRVDKLARENDELKERVEELRHDLDAEQDRRKETLDALSKARRPGRLKWLVLAGGAYVMGSKAGRARYEQMRTWARSMTQRDGDRDMAVPSATSATSVGSTTGTTGTTSRTPKTTGTTGTAAEPA